ncbi:MAG: glycosyltransferase [Planctomycetota bacterium]
MPAPEFAPAPRTQNDGLTQPRVSIIIPSMNQGQFLEQAICSALDQGYDNTEVIVMDGGSDDDSVDILQCYDDELAHWQSEWDSGPAEAINSALARATGQIICILAADDVLLPNTIEDAVKRMTGNKKCDWLVGHAHRIGASHQSLGELTATAPESLGSFLMHDSGLLPLSASFFRKELFSDYGGFRTDLSFAWAYELQARLLCAEVSPTLSAQVFAAVRETGTPHSVTATLAQGREYIQTAEDYANHLELSQRYKLWKNCDERRRIYALAEAETKEHNHAGPRVFLWQQLLRRPWWLGSSHYRQTLLNGVNQFPDTMRDAA